MNELQYKLIKSSEPYLVHYNPNHSKVNGQFISGPGGSSPTIHKEAYKNAVKSSIKLLKDKQYRKMSKEFGKAARQAYKEGYPEERIKQMDEIVDRMEKREHELVGDNSNIVRANYEAEKAALSGLKGENISSEHSIIKQDLETWNRDAIRDSCYNVGGDPYLYAKKNGIAFDESKAKQSYEKAAKPYRKDLISPFEISSFEKDNKLKYVDRDSVKVDSYLNMKTLDPDYKITAESSTKVWKSEVRSKNGVHLIETHPTTFTYEEVAHPESCLGISKQRLKDLNSFSVSKEVSNALREGRKMGPINSAYSYKGGTDSSAERDWHPSSVTFGFSDKGKPVIKEAVYFHKNADKDDHILTVYFDEKHKPHGSSYDG